MNSFWKMFVLGFVVGVVGWSHVHITDTGLTLTYGGARIAHVSYDRIPWQLYTELGSFPNTPK